MRCDPFRICPRKRHLQAVFRTKLCYAPVIDGQFRVNRYYRRAEKSGNRPVRVKSDSDSNCTPQPRKHDAGLGPHRAHHPTSGIQLPENAPNLLLGTRHPNPTRPATAQAGPQIHVFLIGAKPPYGSNSKGCASENRNTIALVRRIRPGSAV